MARPLRIEYSGAVYHITSRGNGRKAIFEDDQDRQMFLSVLGSVVKRYNWLCHAYCLMDNHYHLMIETPDANLSKGMRQLNGIYTQRYNQRHQRPGHIFQGRFKSILVQKENYLLELCRYVVLNPVRSGSIKKPEDWKWSSYQATAGIGKIPEFLTTNWILDIFAVTRSIAKRRYRKFVREGIQSESLWDELQHQVLLGEEDFVEKLKNVLEDKRQVKEFPRSQRFVDRPDLSDIFMGQDTKAQRNKIIEMAHLRYGYALKEIADYLNIHYATVSKVLAKAEAIKK
jgi:REP element-mobilizing transposase RayT